MNMQEWLSKNQNLSYTYLRDGGEIKPLADENVLDSSITEAPENWVEVGREPEEPSYFRNFIAASHRSESEIDAGRIASEVTESDSDNVKLSDDSFSLEIPEGVKRTKLFANYFMGKQELVDRAKYLSDITGIDSAAILTNDSLYEAAGRIAEKVEKLKPLKGFTYEDGRLNMDAVFEAMPWLWDVQEAHGTAAALQVLQNAPGVRSIQDAYDWQFFGSLATGVKRAMLQTESQGRGAWAMGRAITTNEGITEEERKNIEILNRDLENLPQYSFTSVGGTLGGLIGSVIENLPLIGTSVLGSTVTGRVADALIASGVGIAPGTALKAANIGASLAMGLGIAGGQYIENAGMLDDNGRPIYTPREAAMLSLSQGIAEGLLEQYSLSQIGGAIFPKGTGKALVDVFKTGGADAVKESVKSSVTGAVKSGIISLEAEAQEEFLQQVSDMALQNVWQAAVRGADADIAGLDEILNEGLGAAVEAVPAIVGFGLIGGSGHLLNRAFRGDAVNSVVMQNVVKNHHLGDTIEAVADNLKDIKELRDKSPEAAKQILDEENERHGILYTDIDTLGLNEVDSAALKQAGVDINAILRDAGAEEEQTAATDGVGMRTVKTSVLQYAFEKMDKNTRDIIKRHITRDGGMTLAQIDEYAKDIREARAAINKQKLDNETANVDAIIKDSFGNVSADAQTLARDIISANAENPNGEYQRRVRTNSAAIEAILGDTLQMLRAGMKQGVVLAENEDGTKGRVSQNDKWYRDFWAQYGRAPKAHEVEEIAVEIATGKHEMSMNDGSQESEEYFGGVETTLNELFKERDALEEIKDSIGAIQPGELTAGASLSPDGRKAYRQVLKALEKAPNKQSAKYSALLAARMAERLAQYKGGNTKAEDMLPRILAGSALEKTIQRQQYLEQARKENRERESVREKYQGTEEWLKAPNGKPTNLTVEQWAMVRTDSFKKWFGDWENDKENASKALDENGEPRVVYHGTNAAGFDTFKEGFIFTAGDKSVSDWYATSDAVVTKDTKTKGLGIGNAPLSDVIKFIEEKSGVKYRKAKKADFVQFLERQYKNDKGYIEKKINEVEPEGLSEAEKELFELAKKHFKLVQKFSEGKGTTADFDKVRKFNKQAEDIVASEQRVKTARLATNLGLRALGSLPNEKTLYTVSGVSFAGESDLRSEAKNAMLRDASRGSYPLFANVKNPFVVDAGGAHWEVVPVTIDGKSEQMSTDEIAEYAKKNGYDGVIIKNVNDTSVVEYNPTDEFVAFDSTQIKSATENSGDFSADDANIYYQFAGLNSANADATQYNRALGMEKAGQSPEEIFETTGWLKGKDNKWRYEISDNLEDINLSVLEGQGSVKLSEVYDNEELYSAYPFLRDVDVKAENLDSLGGVGAKGAVVPGANRILLNAAEILRDPQGMKTTLVHEVQHVIQEFEGFAVGAIPKSYDAADMFQYRLSAGEQEANETQRRAARLEKLREKLRENGRELWEAQQNATDAQIDAFNKVRQLYFESGIESGEEVERYDDEMGDELSTAWFYYKWARDELNEAQKSMPSIHSDDAIVVFGGQEFSLSVNQDSPNALFQPAWHGSPHVFDEFSLSEIGTGEGAQAHGWGLYFALNREVSEGYRNKLTDSESDGRFANVVYRDEEGFEYFDVSKDEEYKVLDLIENDELRDLVEKIIDRLNDDDFSAELDFGYELENLEREYNDKIIEGDLDEDEEEEINAAIDEIQKLSKAVSFDIEWTQAGSLFKVEIPEDDVMLREDADISEQPEKVKTALQKIAERLSTEIENGTVEDADAAGNFIMAIEDEEGTDGEELYNLLSSAFMSDKAASLMLNEHGVKGIRYEGGKDGECAVVFDDKAIAIIDKFNQGVNSARGAYNPAERTIELFKSADASTFTHEMAHFYLGELEGLAKESDAAKSDFETVFRWASYNENQLEEYKDTATYNEFKERHNKIQAAIKADDVREVARLKYEWMQERFARGFEEYLRKGDAPVAGLKRIFRKFKQWLVKVYKDCLAVGAKPSAEVEAVMARMVATDEEIEEQALARFDKTLEYAKNKNLMYGAEILEKAVEDAKEQAKEKVLKGLIEEYLSKDADAHIENFRAGVEADLREVRAFQAAEMAKDVGEKDAAEIFGYDSVDAYREDLANSGGSYDAEVERQCRAERERYMRENPSREDIAEVAAKELETGAYNARIAEAEAEIISRAKSRLAGKVDKLRGMVDAILTRQKTIREFARETLSTLPLRDSANFRLWMRNAAKERRKVANMVAKDFNKNQDAILRAKLREARYEACFHEAVNVEREKTRIENAIKRRLQTLQKDKKAEIDASSKYYISLLAHMGGLTGAKPRAPQTLVELSELLTIDELDKDEVGIGVPDWVVGLTTAKEPRKLTSFTIEELRELRGAIDRIYTQSKYRNRTFEDGKSIADVIETFKEEYATKLKTGKKALPKYIVETLIPENMLETLGDVFRDEIYGRLAKGEQEAAEATEKAFHDLSKLFREYWPEKKERNQNRRAVLRDAEGKKRTLKDGTELTKEKVVCMALNWGNVGNRQRLLNGLTKAGQYETKEQDVIDLFTETMTAADWKFVQSVWDYINQYGRDVNEVVEKTVGTPMRKVEADSFTLRTADGQAVTVPGGYYPIKYETVKGGQSAENDITTMAQAVGGAAAFGAGMGSTKARGMVGLRENPLRLDYDVLFSHIKDQIHISRMRIPCKDAYKILCHKDTQAIITDTLGGDAYDSLKRWVENVWIEPRVEKPALLRWLDKLRANTVAAIMSHRVSTALLNASNPFYMMRELGVVRATQALLEYGASPKEIRRIVKEKSVSIRNRAENIDTDLNKADVDIAGVAGFEIPYLSELYNKTANKLIEETDMLCSIPAWYAAYKDTLNAELKKGTDADVAEKKACMEAERVVRKVFGSAKTLDSSAVKRSKESMMKAFTPFYTFSSTQLNAVGGRFIKAYYRNDASVWDGVQAFFLTYVAAVILEEGLRGVIDKITGSDDDPFDEGFFRRVAMSSLTGVTSGLPGINLAGDIVSNLINGERYASRQMGVYSSVLSRFEDVGVAAYKQVTKGGQEERLLRSSAKLMLGAFRGTSDTLVDAAFNAGVYMSDDKKTFNEFLVRSIFDRRLK